MYYLSGVNAMKSKKNEKIQNLRYVSEDRKDQIQQVFDSLKITPYLPETNDTYFQEFTLLKSEGIQFSTSSSSI
jgi:arginyl-tRNA synthetase